MEASAILKQAYLRRKSTSKGFTLSFLAKKLNLSAPFVSQILNGRRPIPVTSVDHLCEILDIDKEKRDQVLKTAARGKSKAIKAGLFSELAKAADPKPRPAFTYQPVKNFWLLEEAHYLPILNATLLADYDGTPGFVAAKLGLPVKTVAQAFERLVEHKFLVQSGGRLQKSANHNDFSSDKSKAQLRSFHRTTLETAIKTLDKKVSDSDLERRLITGSLATVRSDKVPAAKQRLREFLQELSADLAAEEGDEVYQISLQFFPVDFSVHD